MQYVNLWVTASHLHAQVNASSEQATALDAADQELAELLDVSNATIVQMKERASELQSELGALKSSQKKASSQQSKNKRDVLEAQKSAQNAVAEKTKSLKLAEAWYCNPAVTNALLIRRKVCSSSPTYKTSKLLAMS
jgi:phage-related minor tail protein